MGDWLEQLSPDERTQWDEFVEHFRRDALEKMSESAIVISLVPERGFDVKFAVELGAAIMTDKPIMAVLQPGAQLPAKLAKVAEEVVVADLDTEKGRQVIREALSRMTEHL